MSAALASPTRAIVSPVAGSITSIAPPRAADQAAP
jgi:hypothetical protein